MENTKELVAGSERRINVEVRRQERLDLIEKKNYRRGKLPEKYTAKMLYR